MAVSKILFFENGDIAVFDTAGEQIPHLQTNLFCDWAKKANNDGFDLDRVEIETRAARVLLRRNDDRATFHTVLK